MLTIEDSNLGVIWFFGMEHEARMSCSGPSNSQGAQSDPHVESPGRAHSFRVNGTREN